MALVSATGALVLAKRALSGGWLEWLRKQGSSLLGWVWAAAAVGSSAAAGSSAAVGAAGESDASVVAAGEADGEGA